MKSKTMKRIVSFVLGVTLAISQVVTVVHGLTDEGFTSGTGVLGDPWLITTPEQLDSVRSYMGTSTTTAKYFKLGKDIDLTDYLAVGGAGYDQWGDSGWSPIGSAAVFYGHVDGAGYAVKGLWINRTTNYAGLFGYSNGSKFSNLGVEIADVGITAGDKYSGGLVGYHASGNITNCYVTGGFVKATKSDANTGGLVGRQYGGTISNCYTATTVTLPGTMIGGLAGAKYFGSVSNSFSNSTVTNSSSQTGGLIGYTLTSSVTNCYFTGSVSGGSLTGGLIGHSDSTDVTNSYATGFVQCVASSSGALIGDLDGGNITNNYFDIETTGKDKGVGVNTSETSGVIGLMTSQMVANDMLGSAFQNRTASTYVYYPELVDMATSSNVTMRNDSEISVRAGQNEQGAEIQVELTTPATPIDVTLTDIVSVSATKNATEITFDDLVIINNSNVGVLECINISITGVNGWTKVASTFDFTKVAFNSKTFAVTYGDIDLLNSYSMNLEVNPNASETITLTGYTGGVTSNITAQEIANVIINLEYK